MQISNLPLTLKFCIKTYISYCTGLGLIERNYFFSHYNSISGVKLHWEEVIPPFNQTDGLTDGESANGQTDRQTNRQTDINFYLLFV